MSARDVQLTPEDREAVWRLVTQRYALSGGSLLETFAGCAAEYALLKEALAGTAPIHASYHDARMVASKDAAGWLTVTFEEP